jgi:hypothetical protein
VALNMVYLGAIGVVFVALFLRWRISDQGAWASMVAGFTGSLLGYLAGWAGLATLDADLLSLLVGLAASFAVFGSYALSASPTPVDLASHVRAK